MPLSVKNVRFTTRRDAAGDPLLYPRLLKDRAILTSIDVATQYFETMVGEERRALDPEALVHFFGDYKVARGMVASLGRTYRYRALSIEETVSRTAWKRLERAGLAGPGALRALLWDTANADRSGFLDGEDRLRAVGTLETRYALRAGQFDRASALDAPEHAILTRLGAPPEPADVLAEYRRSAVTALLAHAERVELTLGRGAGACLDRIGALAQVERVEVDLAADGETDGGRVAVRGQQDAFGSWARQGRRVARFVQRLLERVGAHVEDGAATVLVRGRRARLRLAGETLDALLPRPQRASRPDHGWATVEGWDDLAVGHAIGPGQPSIPGWVVRRDPEPRAWAAGLLVPDLLVRQASTTGDSGLFVCLVRTPQQAQRLATLQPALRGGEPVLFAGPATLVNGIRSQGGWTMELDRPALTPLMAVVAGHAPASERLAVERPAGRRRRSVA